MNQHQLQPETDPQFQNFLVFTYPKDTQKINLSSQYQIPIHATGAKIVMEIINWPITYINLSMYNLQDQGMQEIIKKGDQWPTIEEIILQKNKLTCSSMKAISECHWKNLTKLNLDKNNIRTDGFREMIKADWPNLKILWMSHNQIGEEGSLMLKNSNWPNLFSLNLNYNLIGNEGLRQLSACEWIHLENLQLSNNKLDGKGMFFLSKLKSPKLKRIGLNRNHVGRVDDQLCDLGAFYLAHLQSNKIESFHICSILLMIVGNELSLTGMKMILRSGRLVQNCFIEAIRNEFSFGDIKPEIEKYDYFCNYFEN